MIKTISFKTSGLSGDIIHYLAGIKEVCRSLDAKADLFVWLNQPCFIYEGAQHPYGNVMVNDYAFNMLKPLVEAQSYINSFQAWSGQEIQVDLDRIREIKSTMPHGSLSRWIYQLYPDMTAPIHEDWLELDSTMLVQHNDVRLFDISEQTARPIMILINRTSRYRNPWISYFFLERYRPNIAFVGLPEEHKAFQEEWKFELPYIDVADFYQLAKIISSCKFFIGNQSMCFAIAEALKVPRILETCQFAPNVIPTGPGAHDFILQQALTYFVDKLSK